MNDYMIELKEYKYSKDKYGNLHREINHTQHGELLDFYSENIYLSSQFWKESILSKKSSELNNLIDKDIKKASELKSIVSKHIQDFGEVGKLLDIGCGVGSFLNQLKETNLSLVGYDISKLSLEISEKIYGKQRFKIYECEALEKIKSSVPNSLEWDYIVVFDFIEHIKNDVLFIDLLKTQLKINGRMILEVPIFNTSDIERLVTEEYLYPEHHLHLYSEGGLDNVLHDLKFDILGKESFRQGKKIIYILGV